MRYIDAYLRIYQGANAHANVSYATCNDLFGVACNKCENYTRREVYNIAVEITCPAWIQLVLGRSSSHITRGVDGIKKQKEHVA